MWISTDPALGENIPQAPINDEAKKYNQNLPGMGGVFNHINSNLYHYAGNNPVKYTDPDGRSDLLNFLYNTFQNSYGSEGADFLFNTDPSLKLMVVMDAASKGDVSAQAQLKWAFHEASREILSEISEKSASASVVCLAIGCPQGASFLGGISMTADGVLLCDDYLQGNHDELLKNGAIFVVGIISPFALKTGTKSISKSIQITIGTTGKYYEVGHRGAIKSEKALRKLLVKDIADGYFGQEVIPNSQDIIEQAVKIYKTLEGNENE